MASIYLMVVVWLFYSRVVSWSDARCSVKFSKVGCYKDDEKAPRPLPDLLSTDRNVFSPKFSGIPIDWGNWDKYMEDAVCRCARKASVKSYMYFGLQYYGECWSGADEEVSYDRDGISQMCVTNGYEVCETREKDTPCVGENHANFVYKITPEDHSCVVKFSKVGCFHDNFVEPRPFPVMLLTDRDPESPKYSGVDIDWSNWNTYIQGLACRCSIKTREEGYESFSLQNYGECWSGPRIEAYPIQMNTPERCLGRDLGPCADEDKVCVGRIRTNYVFHVK
ncbi:predicted protein [Nematostella vectensis]|uniref:Uncharacterized protein n=1 Tax=Nematostella vectensis TaxID=45351 RepID=A7RQZ8_NEMVE|nr:uncharacterized protein LOC5518125 [Nematostella vectensis]EDO46080.1 predicted protein [Nematostella vectensis]|eukprot:XP_001638143.1 predicted protein [Nematostella vectensis]